MITFIIGLIFGIFTGTIFTVFIVEESTSEREKQAYKEGLEVGKRVGSEQVWNLH